MYSNLDVAFEDFLINIALTKGQADLIEDAMQDALALFLTEYEGDIDIYAQGSFAMGTTVRPLTALQSKNGKAGEYDIDIAIQRSQWRGAASTLTSIRELLRSTYGDSKVDSKLRETCERVVHDLNEETGVSFHVDYVPIKLSPQRQAPKRSNDSWFDSDTKKVVDWFEYYRNDCMFIPACIVMIKRARDFAELGDELTSIIITTLVCELYEKKESYADDLLCLMDKIIKKIDVEHEDLEILNPAINENLAIRISETSQGNIIRFFKDSLSKLKLGFESNDYSIIQSVLSQSFPSRPENYPSRLESLRSREWGIELDGSLKRRSIEEEFGKGHHVRKSYRKFFGSGEKLKFIADSTDYPKAEYGIRWQVLNSESSGEQNRRGNLFKARGANGVEGSSSNEFVNHETEKYNGEHWIRYYIYSKETRKIVEIGSKFFVGVDQSSSS